MNKKKKLSTGTVTEHYFETIKAGTAVANWCEHSHNVL